MLSALQPRAFALLRAVVAERKQRAELEVSIGGME